MSTRKSQLDVDAATAAIGTRLGDMRSERRLKVSELARRAGVSASLISQIERGTSKPSVGTLFAMAQVLEVPVDSFFNDSGPTAAAPNQRMPAASPAAAGNGVLDHIRERRTGHAQPWGTEADASREVVRYAERARLEIRGGVRWERLTPTPIDGLEFLELIYAPGAESDTQAYRHPGIELVLVTSGTMMIYLGFEQHQLGPGDSIAFPSSTPHRYVNETPTETRAVTVILRDDLSTLPVRRRVSTDDLAAGAPDAGDDSAVAAARSGAGEKA